MLQRDYLMRMIQLAIQAIIDAVHLRDEQKPELSVDKIEGMLGEIADMDPGVLLSLSPDSIGTMLDLGGVMTDSLAETFVRGLVLEADILRNEKNDPQLADLRIAQAKGIARTFELDFDEMSKPVDSTDVGDVTDDIQKSASSD
jgi:hypothetical protein